MKTFKILFAAVLLAGFTTNAFAQQSDNANINANANVLQQIVVTGEQALNFGAVSPGVAKTIGMTDNVTAGTAVSGETTGRFSVVAGNGATITLALDLPTALAEVAGTANLPVSFVSNWGLTDEGTSGTNEVSTAADTDITSFPGQVYVFLGGTVTPEATQASGAYTAEVTLTATYN